MAFVGKAEHQSAQHPPLFVSPAETMSLKGKRRLWTQGAGESKAEELLQGRKFEIKVAENQGP